MFQMKGMTLTQDRAERWLYLFLFIHLIVWTSVPAFVRDNLPLDAIEGTIWGHQLEWGYDKNPFLNGWLTALAIYLDHHTGWMTYLFSQCCVVTCLWAVWKLAKQMLPSREALIAVLILECVQYFNFHAIDFNDNTLELSLWALTIYFFYAAIRFNLRRAWILTGLFAGLSMMAKYYTIALITGMGLFLITDVTTRKFFKTTDLYLAIIAFCIIILPHCIWLSFHDFITVEYVFERGRNAPSWLNHLVYPAQFAWQQFEAFLPALLFYLLFFIRKPVLALSKQHERHSFNRRFLFYVGMVPFLLTLMLSILFGITLRAGWGMPLLSTWGIYLVWIIPPTFSVKKIQFFFITLIIIMLGSATAYGLHIYYASTPRTANFPGREIAAEITQQWHERYHTKLNYVGGSRWISGNIGFYSSDHPAVFIEWNKRRAPWIQISDLNRHGGVFVWDMDQVEMIPDNFKKQFPDLVISSVQTFSWHHNNASVAPVRVGIAFLPPQV